MVNHVSPDKEGSQSNNSNKDSFENLIQQKFEAEQKLDEKYRKVVTILQSDIKGSTEFQRTRGDIEAAARITVHNKLLEPILSKYGGRVLNEMTDGAFAVFENEPEKAVKAAIEFMQKVHEYNEQKHTKIEIRIAMNHGAVITLSDKHYDGLTVSTTARVEQSMKEYENRNDEIADTSLIFISGSVYDEIRNSDDIICRWVDRVEAKGLDKPLELYRVVWNLEQEQTIFKATLSDRETRGSDTGKPIHPVSALKKRSTFILEIARDADKIKISGYEKAEQEQKTIRHYEELIFDHEKIDKHLKIIINLLNQATKLGKVSKEILNNLRSAGQFLYNELFSETIKKKLSNTSSEDIIFNIDDHLVHIPWELLHDGTSFLSLRFNMGRIVSTRQAISEGASRPISFPLKMLILSDPMNNLKSASEEGHIISKKISSMSSHININMKTGDVKSTYVMDKISNFDIVHYAGHSDYDSDNPAQSGWLLHDKKFVANEIDKIDKSQPMPALIFSNACHSGQTGEWVISDDYENRIYGMANAFLLAGVHHYIGTFWEILDEPSSHFAMTFYEHLFDGKPIGEAFRLARKELIKKYGKETIIWASYMLYGDPSFYYINPLNKHATMPEETTVKIPSVRSISDNDINPEAEALALTSEKSSKNKIIYWFSGLAAVILIALSLLFFKQTKQTDVLVKSVHETQAELARQKAGRYRDNLAEQNARQRQLIAVEEKNKNERIDALVAKLASRFRDGTVTSDKGFPVDEWVSRPLVVSLFPLKISGKNINVNQDIILDQFVRSIETSNRIKLVDRDLIDKLLEELNLSSSDLADKQTALRIGKLVGARFIATGSVFSIENDIRLSMKLVETETTSIIKTGSQTGKVTDSVPMLTESVAQEFLDALISKFPLRARIIGFKGNDVMMNIGRNHGIVENIKFNVYREQKIEGSDVAIKKKVGTIKVKDVDENASIGIVLTKTAEFEKNMKLDEAL